MEAVFSLLGKAQEYGMAVGRLSGLPEDISSKVTEFITTFSHVLVFLYDMF